MAVLPKTTNPVQLEIESKVFPQENREYLGMSGIGRKCVREQWFAWRWVINRTINARGARIFNRGDIEEPRIIKDLEAAGMRVYDDQLEIVHSTGHSKGHIDGLVANVPGAEKTEHLAEFKTMKASKFNALKKKALLLGFPTALEELHFDYWVQIQLYMGYLGLKRCLYIITNKDTEERIYERVHFVKADFITAQNRIMSILTFEEPPIGISQREDWFECKFCDFKSVCFGHNQPLKHCRTCVFADLHVGGEWLCSTNDNKRLDKTAQYKGCPQHKLINGF